MICPKCRGVGRIPFGEEPEIYTNEEWLRIATFEELAEWIVHLADDCTMQHECGLCNSWCDEKKVIEWLKQPHSEVKK